MATNKHIVKFWRGSRAAYNALGTWDYWTRYSVFEGDENGNHIEGEPYTEYFGTTCITPVAGQLLPVKTVCSSMPTQVEIGDRFLVGYDSYENLNGEIVMGKYYLVEIGPIKNADGVTYRKASTIKPFKNQSVRVIDRNMKEFIVSNGKLVTYDDVDCGVF
jgi:hypothetical protein